MGPLLPYREVRRGDIVVFLHPDPHDAGTYVVKRIMGVPGDRIHLRNGVVYRNGEALNEPYVDHDQDNPDDFYRNNFPAVPPSYENGVYPNWIESLASHVEGDDLVVPPGHYFAMGDHRGVSLDSRYWGFIPQENVIGRPMFIYWSFETPGDQYTKTGIGRPDWLSGACGVALLRRDAVAANAESGAVKFLSLSLSSGEWRSRQ